MSFEEAKQKIEQKPIWQEYKPEVMHCIPQWLWRFLGDEANWFLELQKVLGDLHHAWCAEAQKTVKELLDDFPKIRGYNNEFYKGVPQPAHND